MSHRAAGISLVGFAVFLFGMTYLSAALFGALDGPRYWPGDVFGWPMGLAFILLALGVAYLVWAEIQQIRGSGANIN